MKYLLALILTLPALAAPLSSNPLAYNKLYLDGEISPHAYQIVADAYAPFDVDVTTIDPGDRPFVAWLRVLGSKPGLAGEALPGNWRFGTAYRAFSGDLFAGHVYADSLTDEQIGKVAVHEAGHLFGLNHQSDWAGDVLVNEYSQGDATTVPWMGGILQQPGKTPVWNEGLDVNGELVNTKTFLADQFDVAPDTAEPGVLLVLAGVAYVVSRRNHPTVPSMPARSSASSRSSMIDSRLWSSSRIGRVSGDSRVLSDSRVSSRNCSDSHFMGHTTTEIGDGARGRI